MNRAPRYAGIDALRGLLALAVVLLHIEIRVPIENSTLGALLPHWAINVVFRSGYYAVMIFFVVSGFLITELSLRRWGKLSDIPPLRFWWLRFARIAPCLLLLLLVASLLHVANVPGFRIDPQQATLGGALFAALTFHVNWYESVHGYLPASWDVLWSLSVEEVFYLCFPLICVAVRSRALLLGLALTLMVLGALSRVWLDDVAPWDEYAWLSCFDGIAVGCVAAFAAQAWHPSATARATPGALLGVGAALAILVFGFRHTTSALGLVRTGLNVTVLQVGIALILVAIHHGAGRIAFTRGTGLLRLLGRGSYEIYLAHSFVVLTLVHLYQKYAGSPQWIPLLYAGVLILSGVLGVLVARWYSEPANRWLRGGIYHPNL